MSFKVKTAMLALCLSGSFGVAVAKGTAPVMTTEQRQKMAGAHEKAAACLRSDRPVAECHEEMMKGCQEAMGKACPMMGGMGGMKRHGRMMQSGPAN